MPTLTVYTTDGKESGAIELNPDVFEIEPNMPLVHQAVTIEMSNMRRGTRNTLTRGEVAGGGRKPWRQKGTGRARQGSIRAPQWVHGGIVFGPHQKDYRLAMPKKMKHGAIRSALSARLAEGSITVVDDVKLDEIRTKKMVEILNKLDTEGKVLLVIDQMTEEIVKSSRNIPYLRIAVAPAISLRDILDVDRIVATKAAVAKLEEAFAK